MLLKKSELDFKNEGKLQELYVIGSEIGKGSFGKVRNVYHKITRQQRACKCVPKDTVNQNLFDSEVENLVLLDHPNVLRIHEYFESANNYYIITELCNGKSLNKFILENGSLPEKDAMKIFQQILVSINYIHSMGVSHRDIKPDNFMVTKDLKIKLIDFGLSCTEEIMRQKVGSPMYIAPEII